MSLSLCLQQWIRVLDDAQPARQQSIAATRGSSKETLQGTAGAVGAAAVGSEVAPGQMLQSLQWELNRIQRTIRLTLQSRLQSLVGQSLETIEENRELAQSIQKILDAHSLRIRCPQCGHAAILRVSPRKGMPAGAFVLDHTIDGKRTFHGGSASVPPIQLTAKPERKPRSESTASSKSGRTTTSTAESRTKAG
ncbi:hypothetical protein [Rhodopirellula halodulae]|uniref:hypothetical protein n=1 Tax=Rhodopirellula halodulae TaxID=2894198 RepID=UPI001E5B6575|nr:hypothetical protein [Rhodopirellula sp. JC737]MCC9654451.1 hypothetical protein [Rhodopirellula sp. JC737]